MTTSEDRVSDGGFIPTIPRAPRFSRALTWALTLALIAGFANLAWEAPDPHADFFYPGYTAVRTFDAQLDVIAAAEERGSWLSRYLALWGQGLAQARGEAIDAYRNVLSYWERSDATVEADPRERDHVRAHLAIVLLESGRTDEARSVLEGLDAESRRRFIDLVSTAYPDLEEGRAQPSPLTNDSFAILGWGWASRRLVHRLIAAGVDPAPLGLPSDPATLAHVPELASVTAETVLWLAVLAVGVAALVVIVTQDRAWSRIGDAVTIAPWCGATLWAVAVRGLALGLVVGGILQLAWNTFGSGGWVPGAAATWLAAIVLIVRRMLLRPYGFSWSRLIGIPARPGTEIRLVLFATAALAADALGAAVIGQVAYAADLHVPWTEGILEGLLDQRTVYWWLFALDVVVLAPVLEEMLMRGVLYPTMRRVWSPLLAATLSGAVFAGLHGYGIVGSLALLWTGIVAALAYERTGTLLVPIVVHSVHNLSVALAHVRLA